MWAPTRSGTAGATSPEGGGRGYAHLVPDLLVRMPPIMLGRGQALIVLAIVFVMLLVGVVGAIVDVLFGGGVDLTQRATGHQRRRKTAARAAIDSLEARLSGRS